MSPARGQALSVACVILAVAVVAVVATINLGTAVHERIRLQNAADAASFSSAALEARAFNLYAYANRTQASHYVSAMVLQSYLSFAYFGEAWLTDADGLLRTVSPCAQAVGDPFWAAACPILAAIPAVAQVLAFLRGALAVLDGVVAAYQGALRSSGVDFAVGRQLIPDLLDANADLAQQSTRSMLAALSAVSSSSLDVAKDNDPRARVSAFGRSAASVSTCLFDRAHVREANGSPLQPVAARPLEVVKGADRDGTARAKRAMAQVANASRFGCGGRGRCLGNIVTSRTADLVEVPAWLGPLKSILESQPKWGQTRLLSHGLARGWDDAEGGNFIREPEDAVDAPSSMLAQGDDLGSDDLYALRIGPARVGPFRNPLSCGPEDDPLSCWGDPRIGQRPDRPFRFAMKTSIWALNDQESKGRGGLHWRVAFEDGYPEGPGWHAPNALDPVARALGLNEVRRRVAPGVVVPVFIANVRPIEDGHHPWRGLMGFPHFEPGRFAQACEPTRARGGDASLDRAAGPLEDFNQPSTYAALSKPDAPILPPLERFSDRRRREVVAVARAQAYYHRPGNWAEAPNFFNPYWRARLAPLSPRPPSAAALSDLWSTLPDELREVAPCH